MVHSHYIPPVVASQCDTPIFPAPEEVDSYPTSSAATATPSSSYLPITSNSSIAPYDMDGWRGYYDMPVNTATNDTHEHGQVQSHTQPSNPVPPSSALYAPIPMRPSAPQYAPTPLRPPAPLYFPQNKRDGDTFLDTTITVSLAPPTPNEAINQDMLISFYPTARPTAMPSLVPPAMSEYDTSAGGGGLSTMVASGSTSVSDANYISIPDAGSPLSTSSTGSIERDPPSIPSSSVARTGPGRQPVPQTQRHRPIKKNTLSHAELDNFFPSAPSTAETSAESTGAGSAASGSGSTSNPGSERHASERPPKTVHKLYVCTQCDKGVRKADRVSHCLGHMDLKEWQCACGETFCRRSDVKRHIRERAPCLKCHKKMGRYGNGTFCSRCIRVVETAMHNG